MTLSDIAARYSVFNPIFRVGYISSATKEKIKNGLSIPLNCLSTDCPLLYECTNHVTAGDFRSEQGISPNLKLVEDNVLCDKTGQLGGLKVLTNLGFKEYNSDV